MHVWLIKSFSSSIIFIFCLFLRSVILTIISVATNMGLLYGEYNNIETAENYQERPILITKGYSRDHRPDLKQCVLDLIFL